MKSSPDVLSTVQPEEIPCLWLIHDIDLLTVY